MRKRLAILGILTAIALPALAAKRLTVEQVQQIIASAAAAHRTDDSVAAQIFDAELTTRLSPAGLEQLISTSPGPRTTQALRALADASVFIDPAPGELPTRPVPTVAAQKSMLSETIHYVARTLHTLPDFLATRETEHYDDSPRAVLPGEWPTRAGMHFQSRFEAPIAYQDGRETDAPSLDPSLSGVGQSKAELSKAAANKKSRKQALPSVGLTSWGEFGPILEIVLVDAAKGKLGWSHWEQRDGKPVAVYQFAIDRSVSHYTVQYSAKQMGERIGAGYGSREGGISPGMQKDTDASASTTAGYHGQLTLDPDTGTILRITIEADLPSGSDIQKAAIMVEYGPVKIGDTEHICPTRSVSLSLSHAFYQPSPISPVVDIVELQLNDVKFTNYRRFGSEATLVMSSDGARPSEPAGAPNGSNAPSAATVSAAPPSAAASVVPEPASVAGESSAHPEAAPVAESGEEVLVRDVSGLPGMGPVSATAGSASPAAGSFTLKVTTRFVDLGLIVTDKHGKPISDLKQDEIEVYDNGRKQRLVSFFHPVDSAASVQPQTSAPTSAPTSTSSDTFTNAAPSPSQGAPDLLILLMDESHLPFNDLNQARGQVLSFLKASRPNTRLALYSISEHGFRVLQDVTTDRALVESKLAAWMPTASAVAQAQEEDRRNRQQFDTVHSFSDLNSVNGNFNDVPDNADSIDPELRQMGDDPLRWALNSMLALARHFASVPGHKSLAWISGDSVLVDWQDKAVGREKETRQIDTAVLHTREALNEAHIALYAVDASPVNTGAISAELKNRNVELDPTVTVNQAVPRDNAPGRITAQMQQDTRAIQTPLRQLAEATGGRAINKGSDLKAALESVAQDSAALYEAGFDPDTPADGKFHTLLVKIPARKEVKLRYRSGYLYNEESTSAKDRFQQAVWSPQDATGITLTAEAVSPADSASGQSTVKLRIALAGLALEQKAGRWSDNLYIFTAQRNDATQKAQVSGDTLRLSLKPATYESGMPAGIPYQNAFDAASRQGSVRVIVIDGNSGKIGSVTLPSSALHP